MAIVAPNQQLARAEMRYTWDNQEVENTLWFHNAIPWTITGLDMLTEALEEWRAAELRLQQSTAVVCREIYARVWVDDPAPAATRLVLVNPSGAVVSASLPNSVTIAVKFSTPFTGRSTRGRNFFIGLTETDVTANVVASVKLADIQQVYANLQSYVDTYFGGDVQHSVASLYSAGLPRAAAVSYPVTAYSVTNAVVDSQRRRLPGRGR